MKLNMNALLMIVLALNCSIFAQEMDWFEKIKSIELLKATRENILEQFGQPELATYPYFKTYKLPQGEMNIEYSQGFCSDAKTTGWNVPEFTITRIFLFPNKGTRVNDLKLGLSGFNKSPSIDVPGAFGYNNEDLGIDFDVTSKGDIEAIELYPPKKLDDLYCGKLKN